NRGASTRKLIARDLNLSLPTVTNNLQSLIESGHVYIDGTFESTGGRKAFTYKCCSDSGYAIGVDITKHHLNLVIVDMLGIMIADQRIRIYFEDTDSYYQTVSEHIESMLDSNEISRDKILGTGVSLPIIIAADQKTITYAKVIDIADGAHSRISKFIKYPVLLFNDANSAGFAEWWRSEIHNTAVYIALNPSIGGATINSKVLYTGDNNRASEFGHITIVPGGRRCYCGKRGCVDAYCSEYVLTNFTDGNLDQFFEELPNNAGYRNTFDEYLYHLALAVNTLRVCYDCDIIIGGNVGAHMGEYVNVLKEKALALNPFDSDADYILPCHYITSASAVGAALHFIKKFVEEI
ncbi:MAG: ROK family protein, partial [Prevotellaceae bacterium]|nr:ROK family protein [Prevotellaceae bacterium]